MSFLDCINNGEKEGNLTAEQAEKARRLYASFEAENRGLMAGEEAAAKASQETFDALEKEAKERVRRTALQRKAQRRVLEDIDSFKGATASDGMTHIVERDGSGKAAYSNLASRREAIRGFAHAKMDNILGRLKKTVVLGRTTRAQKAESLDLVRELFDVDTGNASAKEMAQAWKDVSEWLRTRFNAAGGSIPKRLDWGMPQNHDSIKVGKATEEEWIAYIEDKLDWQKMVDETTGRPIAEADKRELLQKIRQTIVTEGFNKISDEGPVMGRSLARRRQDHRFLVFKSAEDWLSYQDKFGSGDAFNIMMNHIDGMARDIAMLQILGPNPNSTVRLMKQQVEKKSRLADARAGTRKNIDAYRKNENAFDEMYGIFTGTGLAPVNEKLALGFSGLGELLSAAQLGSTALLAIFTDTANARMQARIAGMPQARLIGRVAQMAVASKMTKQEAIRAGLVAENWSAVAYGQTRYLGDLLGPGLTRRISNTMMNVSLLSPWTQASRWAHGVEVMGYMADNIGLNFDALPDKLRRKLDQYGITSEDWGNFKKAKLHKFKGATLLRPTDVTDISEQSAFKFLEMIQKETDLAIPVSTIRARAVLRGSTRPGTLIGSLAQSAAQYKNFPVTFYTNNIRQITNLDATKLSRAGYAAELMVTSVLMGALAMQFKEVAKGRNPIPMFDEQGNPNLNFWGAAVLTSGGLGIFGDFLFSNVNRMGGGLAETVAGPGIGFFSDLRNLTVGNVQQALSGEDTKVLPETVEFLGRYLPGTSLWYARAGIERVILDNVRRMSDPDAEARFRRMRRTRKREYGQDYWWGPGESRWTGDAKDLLPRRAPDLSSIVSDLPR